MISAQNLTKIYKADGVETSALNQLNLQVDTGSFVAIMGPSGCGKSTLLNLVGLLDAPTAGSLYLFHEDVQALSEKARTQWRKSSIGFIFQNFNLIDDLTAYENIELPLIYLKIPSRERRKRVEEVMQYFEIIHRKDYFPLQLSGGQQQKIAIARAIVSKPKLILADEPTGNLDSKNGEEIMELLVNLNKNGSTILMVTHSLHDANFAQKIVHMMDGKIIAEQATYKMSYTT